MERKKPRHRKQAIKSFLAKAEEGDSILFNGKITLTYQQLQGNKSRLMFDSIETIEIFRDKQHFAAQSFNEPYLSTHITGQPASASE